MIENMPSLEGRSSSLPTQKIFCELEKISHKPDEEILLIILKETAKRASFLNLINEAKSMNKIFKSHRCASVSCNLNKLSQSISYKNLILQNKLNLFQDAQSIADDTESHTYPLLQTAYGKSIDLKETVESIYNKLISQYSGTSWCKLEDKALLHIVALKQFWFDCCVCDQTFYSMLFDSLSNKVWINAQGFFKCMESAQKVSAFNIFSLKRYDKKIQKRFLVQKMLCKEYLVFFCCVQYDVGPCLTKESLFKVLVMANKKEKTQVMMWVDWCISSANSQRGRNQDFIKFHEFMSLVINLMNM
ncbi:hypothetical protein SteCoe_7288 [Stentor coeruleus]|uniref:Uncharacterized protein n=1 Tax=Stentor coeruleus TaxID=5963 RepID=A0A1R2CMX8_9CILI|nr:hypothetical protein SteCoe_7288 [Stentor coeruleus]